VTGDTYVAGSELGHTERFNKHVCDAISLACKSAGLPLQFGDRQAALPPTEVILTSFFFNLVNIGRPSYQSS
jgi:hypothetical protein